MAVVVKKGRPALPAVLMGRFFVVSYRRAYDDYVILLDNAQRDSFELGADITAISGQFALWGCKDLGQRAIDMARSFGAAQAIFKDGRVIALFDRKAKRPPLFDTETLNLNLPALAGSAS